MVSEMTTTRVLLHKKTGNIFEGHRVALYDNGIRVDDKEWGYRVSLDVYDHDGWILNNPKVSQLFWFMNRKFVEEDFEDLGNLE